MLVNALKNNVLLGIQQHRPGRNGKRPACEVRGEFLGDNGIGQFRQGGDFPICYGAFETKHCRRSFLNINASIFGGFLNDIHPTPTVIDERQGDVNRPRGRLTFAPKGEHNQGHGQQAVRRKGCAEAFHGSCFAASERDQGTFHGSRLNQTAQPNKSKDNGTNWGTKLNSNKKPMTPTDKIHRNQWYQ